MGEYNVVPLEPPFSPERYIEAIKACENAGMEVIIIDSVTHEWDGKGGCLESNDLTAQTKFKGNTWSAWSVTTPRHQKFIDAITHSVCHVITTARSKTDTIQTEDKKVKKVGMKDIQREGFEYELTVAFNIDREGHLATTSKDRTGLFIDKDPFVISEETGRAIVEWNKGAAENPEEAKDSKMLEIISEILSAEDNNQLKAAYEKAKAASKEIGPERTTRLTDAVKARKEQISEEMDEGAGRRRDIPDGDPNE